MTFRPFSNIYYAVGIQLKDIEFYGDVAKHLINKLNFFPNFLKWFYWCFVNVKWLIPLFSALFKDFLRSQFLCKINEIACSCRQRVDL